MILESPGNFCEQPVLTEQAHRIMPYAQFINLRVGVDETQGSPLFALPFSENHIGNVFIPALHAALVGGFLECASILFLYQTLHLNELPKMIDFSLEQLRSGKTQTAHARCVLTRHSNSIANITASMWQDGMLIATGRAHFKLPEGFYAS